MAQFIAGVPLVFALTGALADEPVGVPALTEPAIEASDRDHWSWRPLHRPDVPAVQGGEWCRGDIDRFVLARLEAAGLTPQPPADRLTLLRRVTIDLTGLPPTPAALATFLADASPDAYEKVIEGLLASPAYGERWAQHWLDVAGFAESDGFEFDAVRPQAWRYRDWVIDALNRDVPYDRFVHLQLAGDELAPGDEAAAIATGFCLCGPDMPDINSQQERRHVVLNQLTSAVGSVFLGLQMGCAQCHDHKFDPISQADFYRLRAIFEPAVTLKDSKFGRTLSEQSAEAPASYLWMRGDHRTRGADVQPGFPRIANLADSTVANLVLEVKPAADAKSTLRRAALATWLTRPDNPLTARVIVNRLWQFHFGRGLSTTPSDFGVMGESPSHPELLDYLATEMPRRGWSLKQIHRLMLLSATYQQASRPVGEEFASESSSAAREGWRRAQAVDPANHLLWRMNRQRLEAEAIRDSMLAAADRLSSRRGGQGIMTPLAKELVATTAQVNWKPSDDAEDHRRRSIYLFASRNMRLPFFEVFDRPDANGSCPQRNQSTTAPQALTMLNSDFALTAARDLAGLLYQQEAASREARLTLAIMRTWCRVATAEELADSAAFVEERAAQLRATVRAAADLPLPTSLAADADPYEAATLALFCLTLLNSNEFLYVD